MRRATVLGFLVLCVVGVIFLLLEMTGDSTGRRGGAAGSAAHGGGSPGSRGSSADADGAAGGGAAEEGARDDDPNRIPGPDVTVRGRVVRGDAGVAGAEVAAMRARAWLRPPNYRSPGKRLPIATAQSQEGGHFQLTIPRRRAVVLHASSTGSAFARSHIFLPETGDPPEVTLRLAAGRTLDGSVVTAKGEPVADAPVTLQLSDWRTLGFSWETKTDADGLFRVGDLRDGTYQVVVKSDRFPETQRRVTLPLQTHVQVVLVPGGAVKGVITMKDGTPLKQAKIRITTRDAISGQTGGAEAQTDETGAYRIESVMSGAVQNAWVDHAAVGRAMASRRQFALPAQLVKSGEELAYDIQLEAGVAVRGRAVVATSGAPVAGARMVLLQMNTQYRNLSEVATASTDAEGRFEFAYVTEGTYAFEATATDMGRIVNKNAQGQTPLTIDFFTDGETAPPEQRVELTPTGGVRGKLIGYEATNPQYGISINLMTPQGTNSSGRVDDLGAFVFLHVPPTDQAIVQSWNPEAKSDPVTVVPGRFTEVELDATGEGGFTGIVEDEEGRPVAGARVQAMQEQWLRNNLQNFLNSGGWGVAVTDASGRFHYRPQQWMYQNMGGLKWVAVASHADYALGMSQGTKLPKKGETKEVRIVLKKGGTVAGRVEFEGGGLASNITVTLSPKKEKGAPFETRQRRTAYTDFGGRFEVGGVAQGIYRLSVSHPTGRAESQEVQAGDRDVLVVISATESIAGVVVDESGKPVQQAQVSAIIPTRKGETKKPGSLQGGGRFRISHLEPGAYAIEVAPQKQGWAVMTSFETKRIDPVPTGSDNVVIVVSDGPLLEGRVLSSSGKAIPGAGVIAMPLKPAKKQSAVSMPAGNVLGFNQNMRPSAITNGRGEFVLKGLGADEVELVVIAQNYRPATRRAVAGGGRETIRLEPGAVIESRLLRADGKPLAGQWVNLQPKSQEVNKKIQDWQQRAGQTWSYLGGWQLLQGNTNSKGEFRVATLWSGEYKLNMHLNDGVIPDTTLRTGAGMVTIQLLPALKVKGRITDSRGRAIVLGKNQQLWVNARQGSKWLRGSMADEQGNFELTGLPAGTVTIQVWGGSGYKPKTVDVTAGDLNVAIVLEEREPPKPRGK